MFASAITPWLIRKEDQHICTNRTWKWSETHVLNVLVVWSCARNFPDHTKCISQDILSKIHHVYWLTMADIMQPAGFRCTDISICWYVGALQWTAVRMALKIAKLSWGREFPLFWGLKNKKTSCARSNFYPIKPFYSHRFSGIHSMNQQRAEKFSFKAPLALQAT